MKKFSYSHTVLACHGSGISQAIINNYTPLLLITLQLTYNLPLERITLLITLNFLTQLVTDFLAARYCDQIGHRTSIVASHILCSIGLVGLGIFPEIMQPFTGLLLAVVLYAIGGGIIEVLNTPIANACPSDNKAAAMSLLHSSYCWGTVLTVVITTVLFQLFGTDNWRLIGCLWALFPLANGILFLFVPIAPIVPEGERGMTFRDLFKQKVFWVLFLMMICAGASEMSMVQWASAFAETGLHVSKTIGDLAGPCFFSILMGLARVLSAKVSTRIPVERSMVRSAVLCVGSYILAVLPLHPLLNLLGCGICGFSVGIFWPGTFTIATTRCPLGGTAMFGLLALAGDLGCSVGPTVVGFVSGMFSDNLKTGLAVALLFPAMIVFGIRLLKHTAT